MATPEGRIKAYVKRRLKEVPVTWCFWPVPCGYGKQALDCIGCTNGHFWAIETKAPKKDLTERQAETAADMREARGVVFKVDSNAAADQAIAALQRMAWTGVG